MSINIRWMSAHEAKMETTIKLWILVREGEDVSDLKEVDIRTKSESLSNDRHNSLIEELCSKTGVQLSKNKVFKLRNGRGSLVPISRKLCPNTVTSPFILEVCERHATVKPFQKQVQISGYYETYQKKLDKLTEKLERLEGIIPELPYLRNAKLTDEMKEVEARLRFMNARMKEAENREWKGMFKKHPLW